MSAEFSLAPAAVVEMIEPVFCHPVPIIPGTVSAPRGPTAAALAGQRPLPPPPVDGEGELLIEELVEREAEREFELEGEEEIDLLALEDGEDELLEDADGLTELEEL